MKYKYFILILCMIPALIFLPTSIIFVSVGASGLIGNDHSSWLFLFWGLGGILGVIGLLLLFFKSPPKILTTILLGAGCIASCGAVVLQLSSLNSKSIYDPEVYMFMSLVFPFMYSIFYIKRAWFSYA